MLECLRIERVGYDHPHAAALTELAQEFYLAVYGERDVTPVTPDYFRPPAGDFLVGYLEGDRPATMAGWHLHQGAVPPVGRRPAELKRMFVHPDHRGRGLARAMLAAVEADAAAAGADWLILETGAPQVAATTLYRASGYVDVPPFGYYIRREPGVLNLGKPLAPTPG